MTDPGIENRQPARRYPFVFVVPFILFGGIILPAGADTDPPCSAGLVCDESTDFFRCRNVGTGGEGQGCGQPADAPCSAGLVCDESTGFFRCRNLGTGGEGQGCGAAPVGAVPDGDGVPGTLLTVHRAGGILSLSWGASCLAADTDYTVYEGQIGDFASHAPLRCTTSGATSTTVTPGQGSHYYLIVPRREKREGSYGTDSAHDPRPEGVSRCFVQQLGSCP